MDRLQLILYKAPPSQRNPSRLEYGEDTQDTIHPEQMPNCMDVGGSTLRLPTPSLEDSTGGGQIIQEELVQDRHRSSDNSGAARQDSSLTHGEDDSRFPLPSAKRAGHNLPDKSQKTAANTSLLDASNQPDLDPSMKLATPKGLSEQDQGYIASSAHPLLSLDYTSHSSSPLDLHHCRHHIPELPRDTTCVKDENRVSVDCKTEEFSPRNKLGSQTAESAACIVDGCLCGCGGDAMHCLRPSRPPSMVDDTFFDKSVDSSLGMLIKLRLEGVVRDLEPSRRIWWRDEFGGCAPDRRPLDSEIRSMRDDNLGSVLRTSLPLFNDATTIGNKAKHQPSRKRQRSMSLPTTATHRQDGNANLPPDYDCPLNSSTKSAPLYESSKKCRTSATEFGKIRPHDVRGRPLFREPIVAPKAKPLKSPSYYLGVKRPPVKSYALGKTPPVNLSELFLKEPPPRPKIVEPTPEENERLRQSGMQIMEAARRKRLRLMAMSAKRKALALENQSSASRCDTVHQAQQDAEVKKKAHNAERFQQTSHHSNQNIEAMKVRKNSRHGTALYRHDRWVPDNSPNVYEVGETQWKSMDPLMRLESYQGQRSMYQTLDTTKLKRAALTL